MTMWGYVTEVDELLPTRLACHAAAGQAVVAHVLGRRIKNVYLLDGNPPGYRVSVERPKFPAHIADGEAGHRFVVERAGVDLAIKIAGSVAEVHYLGEGRRISSIDLVSAWMGGRVHSADLDAAVKSAVALAGHAGQPDISGIAQQIDRVMAQVDELLWPKRWDAVDEFAATLLASRRIPGTKAHEILKKELSVVRYPAEAT